LRPKTFAVLRHLVENSGRLVSKDELFGAAWPNVSVTDDTLVQSIGELRRAIGDNGPQLIKTIPRRGYRFEGKVKDATATPLTAKGAARDALSAGGAGPTLTGAVPASYRRPSRTGLLAASAATAAVLGYLVWSGSPIAGFSSDILSWIRVGSRIPDVRPAIAVLPFLNQCNDSAREYFADGMTQDLITALGRFSELTVMSWNAVSDYRRYDKVIKQRRLARGLLPLLRASRRWALINIQARLGGFSISQ
jgi:hypothetical protein